MERREYLARLDRALRELTGSRERQDILAYYREYLEEAGSGGEAEAIEFTVGLGTKHLGVPLKDLRLRPGVLLAVIVRGKDIIIPEGSSFLQEGDQVIIIARESGILDLNAIYAAEPAPGGSAL